MDTEQLMKASEAIHTPVNKLRADYQAIYAEVEERLNAVRAQLNEAVRQRSAEREALVAQVTHEDLTDPEKAMFIYPLIWGDAEGLAGLEKWIKSLFPNTYVKPVEAFHGGTKDTTFCFTVAIPRNADLDILERTAAMLAPVLQAATEYSSDACIVVQDAETDSYWTQKITWDKEQGEFALNYHHARAAELLDVFVDSPRV